MLESIGKYGCLYSSLYVNICSLFIVFSGIFYSIVHPVQGPGVTKGRELLNVVVVKGGGKKYIL